MTRSADQQDLQLIVPDDVLTALVIVGAFTAVFVHAQLANHRVLRMLARRALSRRPVDEVLDWMRFRVDTFPRRVGWLRGIGLSDVQSATYQELPWVGLTVGRRSAATRTRWQRMQPLIAELDVGSALDLGANVGGLSFRLAEMGVAAVAVEREDRNIRTGLYARRKLGSRNVAFLAMDLDPNTVRLLPATDCVLMLSVWHHLVRDHGLAVATSMLGDVWQHTGRVLFFDTGQDEMPTLWGLPPMTPDPRRWLTQYLLDSCPGSCIEYLGEHDALGPADEPCQRSLFAVIREQGGHSAGDPRAGRAR